MIILIIMVLLLFGIVLFLSLQQLKTYRCDVGEKYIVGDWEAYAKFLFALDFPSRPCAVEDCIAFNDYQKQVGGEELCMV